MQAGALQFIIRIQKQVDGRDASTGQASTAWEDIASRPRMWAQRWYKAQGEKFEADQKAARLSLRLKVHYRKDLDESLTVLVDKKRYDITGIEPLNRRDGLVLELQWTENRYKE